MQHSPADSRANSHLDCEPRTIVHLFKLSSAAVYCVTAKRSGEGLPAMEGWVWKYVKDVDLAPDDQRLAIDSESAMKDIADFGYHLLSGWYYSL